MVQCGLKRAYRVRRKSEYECLFARRVYVRVRLWEKGISYLLSVSTNPWGATNHALLAATPPACFGDNCDLS
jgi:hypothetical protein